MSIRLRVLPLLITYDVNLANIKKRWDTLFRYLTFEFIVRDLLGSRLAWRRHDAPVQHSSNRVPSQQQLPQKHRSWWPARGSRPMLAWACLSTQLFLSVDGLIILYVNSAKCPRWDSNPHAFQPSGLSRLRMPFRHEGKKIKRENSLCFNDV